MVSMSAFQAEGTGSSPVRRSSRSTFQALMEMGFRRQSARFNAKGAHSKFH